MKIKKIIKISLFVIVILFAIFMALLGAFLTNCIKDVKHINLKLNDNYISSEFIDINNQSKIIDISTPKINIENLNNHTINAFIAVEDKDFYKHKGISLKRIGKAVLVNLKNKKYKEGASTITQQFIKNKYLNTDKTMKRKVKEIYLSIKAEKQFSKDEILEEYLNTIYYGHGAYGIENASKKYFNKSANELNLNESVCLASVINSPTKYSPIMSPNKLFKRKNLVLKLMREQKLITEEEYNENINKQVELNINNINYENLNLYDLYALDETSKILNKSTQEIIKSGYKIYTYQNKDYQNNLDSIISDTNSYPKNEYGNIADSLSIIIDNENYGVKAISGNSKYDLLNFKRQPGSLIKPVAVFAPAYEEGIIYPCSLILDEKININGYTPNNVGNRNYGYINVRDIVAKSLNIPTIKIAEKLTLDKCKKYLEKVDIKLDKNDTGYALVLGGLTQGVTLKEITDCYSPFTNNGKYEKSKFISKITTNNNVTIYSRIMTDKYYCSTDNAYLMTETLKYSVANGTSKKLSKLQFGIAGKTGTVNVKNSNLNTDAYSLAYTTKDTMSVWLGNYSMNKEFHLSGSNNGGTFATEIIAKTFDKIYNKNAPNNFTKPDTIIECAIDEKMLNEDHIVALANNTPERYKIIEIFSSKNKPKVLSNKFDKIEKFDFEIKLNKNNVNIKFEAKDYIEYKIYKTYNDITKCIDIISNQNSIYEFNDNSIYPNVKYTYHIEAQNKYNKNVTYKTTPKDIYYQKNISNKTSDYAWLFN